MITDAVADVILETDDGVVGNIDEAKLVALDIILRMLDPVESGGGLGLEKLPLDEAESVERGGSGRDVAAVAVGSIVKGWSDPRVLAAANGLLEGSALEEPVLDAWRDWVRGVDAPDEVCGGGVDVAGPPVVANGFAGDEDVEEGLLVDASNGVACAGTSVDAGRDVNGFEDDGDGSMDGLALAKGFPEDVDCGGDVGMLGLESVGWLSYLEENGDEWKEEAVLLVSIGSSSSSGGSLCLFNVM
ncbi:Aste57867_11721 [Aphanomyces stellatus]|uniref:Aste57867_11721 protein n=1 Tax=Aphanomyces stellatus TaxID=120398 RepID=A0A485KU50_9STRA|nr:hypothetical protein As57867_011678 [Aphanomyces stellatus]VFT88578.1 Aste57867_11721 [Aphanomyces stellatus]